MTLITDMALPDEVVKAAYFARVNAMKGRQMMDFGSHDLLSFERTAIRALATHSGDGEGK